LPNSIRSIRRGLTLAALAGTVLIVVSPAALAQATVSPEAFAIESTRAPAIGPTPLANPTTPGPASVATLTVSGVFKATTLTASVSTNMAQASVASLSSTGILLPLLGSVSSGAITSSCVANSDGTFTKTSNVTNLDIAGHTFNGEAAPNTSFLTILLVGTVILNQQVAGPVTGSQTVNAIDVNLLSGDDIYVASSTCGPWASPVPIASGQGLVLGLGLLGTVGVGYGAVYTRRRRPPGR
jgi:hypothetical protein